MPSKPFDPILTRHSLLARLKDWEDHTSWQDFFDTYWQLIYNVATKAGLPDAEAQEVVQATIIAVARKIAEFKIDPARGSFSAWLMRLTRWRIADQFRKREAARAREAPVLGSPNDTIRTDVMDRIPDPAGVTLETVWQEEWEKHLMTTALEQIKRVVSPRQYQLFDLHVLQNLSVAETTRTVQANPASVYMAKYRIGRLLNKEIQRLNSNPVR